MKLNVYTDGAARGNPGPAGIGVVIYDEGGKIVEEHHRYLGTATNNAAEYQALLAGLRIAKKYAPCGLRLHLDSELVCQQMRGNYRVRDEHLARYFREAQGMLAAFESVEFVCVPRKNNAAADKLANRAINAASALRQQA